MDRYAVALSREAAAVLAALPRQSAGRIVMTLRGMASRGSVREGLFTVASPHDLAACEASSAARVILVYAIVARRELHTRLVGDAIERRARAAGIRRRLPAS
ncbi:MAG: hypothetical protein ACJ75R_09080 [Solirubrobacterales bacterium]